MKSLLTAHLAAGNEHKEIVKILSTLTDNPNAPNMWGRTPIHMAAGYGFTEIFKILVHLTDNSNPPNNLAAEMGHTEIVKILTPFT